MNLSSLTEDVRQIAKETGLFLKNEIKQLKASDIECKGRHDYVTYVDRQSEAFLVSALTKVLPEAGIIAEEGHLNHNISPYRWVIDPLDGTTNYIHGVPLYCVSIALLFNNEPVLGVIYEPNLDECYSAYKGGKSLLNGENIQVSDKSDLNEAFLATGFPSRDYSRIDAYNGLFRELMFDTRGIRRLGSAAMDIAWVACGRFDLFYEYHLSPWDVAAGAIILEMAGGKNTDFNGGNNFIFGREIISSNAIIHNTFLKLLQKHFYAK